MYADTFRAEVKAELAKQDTPAPTLDNTPASWSKEALQWAQREGLLVGDDKGNLLLRSPVTREQLCVFLKRYHDKVT